MVDNLYIKEVCSRIPYNTLMEFTEPNQVRVATIKDLLETHPIEEVVAHGKLILVPLEEISNDVRIQIEDVLDARFSKTGYFNNVDRIWLDNMGNILNILYENHIDFNNMILNGYAENANSYTVGDKFNAYEIYL